LVYLIIRSSGFTFVASKGTDIGFQHRQDYCFKKLAPVIMVFGYSSKSFFLTFSMFLDFSDTVIFLGSPVISSTSVDALASISLNTNSFLIQV
jgi:hypothetical protein